MWSWYTLVSLQNLLKKNPEEELKWLNNKIIWVHLSQNLTESTHVLNWWMGSQQGIELISQKKRLSEYLDSPGLK